MVLALVVLNLALIFVIFKIASSPRSGVSTLQAPQGVPLSAFELVRENGTTFSSAELKDHPWIANFIFNARP